MLSARAQLQPAAFFFFFKERTLVGCFYSKVKEKQQQGPGGAGFLYWGVVFLILQGVLRGAAGGRAVWKGSEGLQTSLGV